MGDVCRLLIYTSPKATSLVNTGNKMFDQSSSLIGSESSQFVSAVSNAECPPAYTDTRSVDFHIAESLASGIADVTTEQLIAELFAVANQYR